MDRRKLLAGLAGLPLTSVALPALAAAPADPFAGFHAEIRALHETMEGLPDGMADADLDALMDRWGEIDARAMANQPTTFAGAAGALEYARREFVQFHLEPRSDGGSRLDPGDKLILHLMDGAIAVLRQAIAGGVA